MPSADRIVPVGPQQRRREVAHHVRHSEGRERPETLKRLDFVPIYADSDEVDALQSEGA